MAKCWFEICYTINCKVPLNARAILPKILLLILLILVSNELLGYYVKRLHYKNIRECIVLETKKQIIIYRDSLDFIGYLFASVASFFASVQLDRPLSDINGVIFILISNKSNQPK
jgi:hypothetical protein